MIHSLFPVGNDTTKLTFGSEPDEELNCRSNPDVLWGDAANVRIVAEICPFAQAYNAGVLSFTEPDVPRPVLESIVAEHRQMLTPGINFTRISSLYIARRTTGMLQIHWWAGTTELMTGRRIALYYDRVDRQRFRLWVQTVNDRFALSDPNDPTRHRLHNGTSRNAPSDYLTGQMDILGALSQAANAREVANREQIIKWLRSNDLQVVATTKRYLTVLPKGAQKAIRLEGRMFQEDWAGAYSESEALAAQQAYRAERPARVRASAASLAALQHRRVALNVSRYRPPKDFVEHGGNPEHNDLIVRTMLAFAA